MTLTQKSSHLQASLRGGFGEERYENVDLQKRVVETFARLRDPTWKVVDASQSLDEVSEEIFKLCKPVLDSCDEGEAGALQTLWELDGPEGQDSP